MIADKVAQIVARMLNDMFSVRSKTLNKIKRKCSYQNLKYYVKQDEIFCYSLVTNKKIDEKERILD